MKVVLCLLIACVFSIANATNYKDEHTLPTDSQELIKTYMDRVHEHREHLNFMCSGFDFKNRVTPGFHFKVDYDYWYKLCWKFEYIDGYFIDYMRPYRAKVIKEVREEFAKKGKH